LKKQQRKQAGAEAFKVESLTCTSTGVKHICGGETRLPQVLDPVIPVLLQSDDMRLKITWTKY